MSLLARASHGYVCRGGAGGTGATVYVPVVVEGLVGYLVEEEEGLVAPLVEEERFLATVLEEEAPLAIVVDEEEPLAGVLVAEEELVGVLDTGSAVSTVIEYRDVEVGLVTPGVPPRYDQDLVFWADAAWPATLGEDIDGDKIVNVPEDRSPKRLEALRTFGNNLPGVLVANGEGFNAPTWEFTQDDPSGNPHGFYGAVGENHGNTPVEVGDTGPRWTFCIALRDDNQGNNLQVRRPIIFNTPYLSTFWNGTQFFVRVVNSGLTTCTVPTGFVPDNRCFIAGVTAFGDGTTQVWCNGFVGPRVNAGVVWSLGVVYWLGGYTTQATSHIGGIPLALAWEQALDPVSDGIYNYVKGRFPGVFTFDNGAGLD